MSKFKKKLTMQEKHLEALMHCDENELAHFEGLEFLMVHEFFEERLGIIPSDDQIQRVADLVRTIEREIEHAKKPKPADAMALAA